MKIYLSPERRSAPHGKYWGYDAYEHDVCVNIAARMIPLLESCGFEVVLADPAKALPFVEMSTSPYATGDCCTYEDHVWRSGQDNNTWAPGTVGVKWTDLGTIEDVMAGVVTEPEPEPSDIPDWDAVETGYAFKTGTQFTYKGKTYNVLRDLTKTPGWEPPALIGDYYEEVE